MRPVFRFAATCLVVAGLFPAMAQARPNFVDLTANQTPIRNQGAQGSCVVFAAVAALEAAYNRAGYGQLDLSEALLNHFGKMMWIEPRWNSTLAKGEDGRESQVGAYSGGGGVQYLKELSNGLRTTVEAAMPYRPGGYTAKDLPHLANTWYSPFWTQRRDRCDYAIDYKIIGDPARGCRKDFAVEWRCTGSAATHRLAIPAEAGLGSVATLACGTSASTTAPNIELSTH